MNGSAPGGGQSPREGTFQSGALEREELGKSDRLLARVIRGLLVGAYGRVRPAMHGGALHVRCD